MNTKSKRTGDKQKPANFRELARAVLDIESKAVAALAGRLDASFDKACEYMLACEGRMLGDPAPPSHH